MKKNVLIVGAGLAGATIAQQLAEDGLSVTLIDQRNHIAGNAYDYTDSSGIRVHKYGPHLFHTNDESVFIYLSRFTEWIPYQHRVKAILKDGSYVTLPPNRNTRDKLGESGIIDVLFRPYTRKMWGMELEELDPKIISRIPIRDDDNELYFPNDVYQYLPLNGYTSMVEKMLSSNLITVSLNTKFDPAMVKNYHHVFNSMPIDEYFDFCFGELPYRSIKFHNVSLPMPKVLPASTVNFTHDAPFTRVTEWTQFPNHGVNEAETILTYEQPCDYRENNFERYYPVKDVLGKNRELYSRYRDITPQNITFVGRCGQYVYLDMHQAVSSSLLVARKYIKSIK
jgi:UDP-galactopyranose mutase